MKLRMETCQLQERRSLDVATRVDLDLTESAYLTTVTQSRTTYFAVHVTVHTPLVAVLVVLPYRRSRIRMQNAPYPRL